MIIINVEDSLINWKNSIYLKQKHLVTLWMHLLSLLINLI